MKLIISNVITIIDAPTEFKAELEKSFTIPNPAFNDALKMGRYTGNLNPTLSFSRMDAKRLILPRGAGRDILNAAKKYGRVEVIDNRLTLPEVDLEFRGTLRPYQHQAAHGAMAKDFSVLEAGTGSGKTVAGLAIIAYRKQPTLILVHTKELLYQWQERIKQFLGIEAGLIGDGKFQPQAITVAIVNSARKALDRLSDRFGHVVVDECHRVPSSTFSDVVTAFPSRYMLGLSATPYRRDGLGQLIDWYLGLHRQRVEMTILHEVGAVLRPKVITRPTRFWHNYQGDYSRMLTALTLNQERNELIATDIRQQAEQGGLSLVVSDRVAHLEILADLSGVDHYLLTGKTAAKRRQQIVASLAGGEAPVLFSTLSLIGEGFDCPAMDSLFLASPIRFSGRLIQTVGRVLRPAEGKEPLVFDYNDMNVGILKHQWKCRQKVFAGMR